MGKIFAIGDIHGNFDKLEKMFSIIDIDKDNDTMVFVGDYIDRGPNSKEVVNFIIDLKTKYSVVCLIGNHEQMLMDFLSGIRRMLYILNGGEKTVDSYDGDIPEDHMDFFRSLLPYYETEDYIFVHAGLVPGLPLERNELDTMLWIREDFILSDYDFGKTVVFGHTPVGDFPLIEDNKIGIDTGACFGGLLTCIELPSKKVFQT